jgi:hypothetical protein
VRIRAATSLNLPNASASGIEGALNDAARIQANGVALTIRMPEARFSGIFLPLQRPRNTIREEAFATLSFDDVGGVTVTIPRADDGSRAAYAWYDGKLTRLF